MRKPLKPEFKGSTKEEENVPPVSFLQLFRYSSGLDKFVLLIGISSSIGSGILQSLSLLMFGSLVQEIVTFSSALQEITNPSYAWDEASEKFMDSVCQFAIYNSCLGLAMLVLSYLAIVAFNFSSIRQIFTIRKLYFHSALQQDIAWYDVHDTGDFASRMSEDILKLEDGLGEKVSMLIHFEVGFVASIILALVKGWQLALVTFTSFPVMMITLGVVVMFTTKYAKQEMDAHANAGSIAEEVFGSIRTVVAFGGQEKEVSRYTEQLNSAKVISVKRSFLTGVYFGLLWFFIYGGYALAFWYGVKLVLEERSLPVDEVVYNPGNMITVFMGVMQATVSFGLATPYIEIFGIARGAAAKIYALIDSTPVINFSKGRGVTLNGVKGNIEFKNVNFSYPSRANVKVLEDITLSIKPGETVAFVGSSGCGKSTCIQLLQRFYDPDAGQIFLDGNPLKKLDLAWLRSNIGVVGQEPILFDTTIAENIKYSNMKATLEDIENAAKRANAHIFITSLPQGYNTLVGERGAQLSGGQKQRIAIARALVREPAILLLDEATSALDTNSEAKVQAALDNASRGCTTIIVAHRLSTIRSADKIFVLEEGKVVEEGNHQNLMNKEGAYYKLVTTQVDNASGLGDGNDEEAITLLEDKKASLLITHYDTQVLKDLETQTSTSLWALFKLNKPEWPQIFIASIASILIGGAMPAFAILFGEIIGVLANPDEDYVRSETNIYVILFVVAGVAIGLSNFFQFYLFGFAGEKLTTRLRVSMFQAILKQDIGWFDNKDNSVGTLCARLSGEAASVQGATGQRIGTILQSISTLLLAVSFSLYFDWKLGLVALAFTPVILLATFFQQRLLMAENAGHHSALERSTKIAVEAVSNIRTVISLGSESVFYENYVLELSPFQEIAKRNTHIRAAVFGLARAIMFFTSGTCMYYGGVLIRDENLPIENVFKVTQSLLWGTITVASALAFTPNLQKGLSAAAKIFRTLNRVPTVNDAPDVKPSEWAKSNINYKEIQFAYPTRPNVRVLRGLDLSILEGQTVALVGPSGCGKSTVLQLLERYYDAHYGSINVDGKDIREIKLGSLRSQMGVVSQEPNLFDRTIGENIAYGDNSRVVMPNEIIAAAKSANIHNFVASLPQGYDTRLGERGTQLSGGQKQRIAIARALVRNPKVLLLDEATSALDAESEKVVQEALDNAKMGRTCITIAHRLSTIIGADLICVINQGRVCEMGTHSELLQQKGIYYMLHRLQKGSS